MKRLIILAMASLLAVGCGVDNQQDDDGDDQDCPQIETSAQDPDSLNCEEFESPCEVPSDWHPVPAGCQTLETETGIKCAQVITWGLDPETGECEVFPTPCDVPEGWKKSYNDCPAAASDDSDDDGDGEVCTQVIVYGEDPETGECEQFPTPCDVPDGWETSYDGCPDDGDDDNDDAGCDSHDDCVVSGCNSEICATESMASPCEALPEHACYDEEYTSCGCFDGTCGWEETDDFQQCLDDPEGFTGDDGDDDNDDECSSDADCVITGCSNHVCADEHKTTTCEWMPEYDCYDEEYTSCGCNDGTCGWAQTDELEQCLEDA